MAKNNFSYAFIRPDDNNEEIYTTGYIVDAVNHCVGGHFWNHNLENVVIFTYDMFVDFNLEIVGYYRLLIFLQYVVYSVCVGIVSKVNRNELIDIFKYASAALQSPNTKMCSTDDFIYVSSLLENRNDFAIDTNNGILRFMPRNIQLDLKKIPMDSVFLNVYAYIFWVHGTITFIELSNSEDDKNINLRTLSNFLIEIENSWRLKSSCLVKNMS